MQIPKRSLIVDVNEDLRKYLMLSCMNQARYQVGHVTKCFWGFMEVFQIELLFSVLPVL